MDITQGRFISYSDIHDNRKAVVIGSGVVNALYDKGEEVIGSYIKINGVNFMVVGVFKLSNNDGNREEEANSIYVPFTTFNQVFNRADNVNWMAITAVDEVSITDLKPEILAVLREQRKIHPEDLRALGNFDRSEAFGRITGLFDILSFVGYFVGALVLLSGVIGISNIMLIVVKERTREIGVRKALGAKPWSIVGMILHEAIFVTAISGFAGLIFSMGLLELVGPYIEVDYIVNPAVNFNVAISTVFVLIFAGAAAGFFPAWRAANIHVIDALRDE